MTPPCRSTFTRLAPVRLHRRSRAPCMASNRLRQPATVSGPSPASPTGGRRRRSRLPRAAGDANDPSVASSRIPLSPFSLRAALVQEPVVPLVEPATVVALRSREPGMPVPRAWHGHAAALGSQDPRACMRTRAARPSRAPASPRCR
jgi:hypothetical protein